MFRPAVYLIPLLVVASGAADAARYPFRVVGVADGLAHPRVSSLLRDHRGYLWVGTWEGVSRFDGREFVNYGAAEGLPTPLVFSLAEDRNGSIWLATWGSGVARLIEGHSSPATTHSRFELFKIADDPRANNVSTIAVGADGVLWCQTEIGLYRGESTASGWLFSPVRVPESPHSVFVDRSGAVWGASAGSLARLNRDPADRFELPASFGRESAEFLSDGDGGSLWVASQHHVARMTPGVNGAGTRWESIPLTLPPGARIYVLLQASGGTLWVGTSYGLIRVHSDSGSYRQELLGPNSGLPDGFVHCLYEDETHGLWIGTQSGGLAQLLPTGIASITNADGLSDQNIQRVIESRDGSIYASSERAGLWELVDGRARQVPGSDRPPFLKSSFNVDQDERGDWWAAGEGSLYRIPGSRPDYSRAQRIGARDGLVGDSVISSGYDLAAHTVWAATRGGWLNEWNTVRDLRMQFRATRLPAEIDGMRLLNTDRDGVSWLGAFRGVGRRSGNSIQVLSISPGLPELQSRASLVDSRGWLWLGLRFQSLARSRNRLDSVPLFEHFGRDSGIASPSVWTLAEDRAGAVWIGTGRGALRWDPHEDRFTAIGVAEGLAGAVVQHVMIDSHGTLWLATSGGVSWLDPLRPRGLAAGSSVYFSAIRVEGEALPLPDRGVPTWPELSLGSQPGEVRLEFHGVSVTSLQPLRYQYRLDPSAPWSEPSLDRALTLARLAPGRNQVGVRAVTSDGQVGPPAELSIVVAAPLWQRPWFLLLVIVAAIGAAYGWTRLSVRHAVALETVRRQIALDLHDEIGSGLSQIAILSEVANRDASSRSGPLLNETATIARTLRESMADIVWAVDPRKDRASDLVQRMRQTAVNLLEAQGCDLQFVAPESNSLERVPLGPGKRRHLLLAMKESLHNAARHAQATKVEVTLTLQPRQLVLSVQDDGVGFDLHGTTAGQGLGSLKRRADSVGGEISIESGPGHGTLVRISVPL